MMDALSHHRHELLTWEQGNSVVNKRWFEAALLAMIQRTAAASSS
jgi:hypothetical protein